ncbi:sugar transferase [Erysipelothrix inopinata]|uniref:Sugar transferase n=1 Tax=Erysipelothrix inopinata TaxID=225084 RepID=A0A7G9RXF0_9FIRM|nr:sugar transferase [Erysipelothrix inopinata]QNN60275.1 sugar transferase [Erysipelothrix inopinata]
MKKNLKSLTILTYKLVVYYLLYTIFFQMFELYNVGLQYVSRTTVITTMTFAVILVLMVFVYGNFSIGKQKSKPIIFSTSIAVVLTDIVTYIQLMIMNTNPHNNQTFRIEQLDILLYVILMQVVVITIAAYVGNWLYFKLYTVEHVLIVKSYGSDDDTLRKIHRYLSNYKLQYRVVDVIDYSRINSFNFSDIDRVVCVGIHNEERSSLTDFCYKNGISISFTPEVTDVVELAGEQVVYDDIPLIVVESKGLSFEQKFFKRTLDLICSIFGLILSSPIWIIAGIAIKLNDGGKIFFRQERYTENGKVFKVFKFRTMKENVANYSSTENDDRITAVGKVLRKTRMDELPQILNIIKGDMSMVGPRPEMLENVHEYESDLPQFRYRLKVKAGLTGIAQIEGKYNTTPKDKLIMDLMYIENYSVWMDIKLILRTATVLVKKESTEGFGIEIK